MLNAKALRHAMIDADCSMKELAQVCKISPSALNRRMRGKVQFTLGEVMSCEERLNLSMDTRNKIFFAREFPKGNARTPEWKARRSSRARSWRAP